MSKENILGLCVLFAIVMTVTALVCMFFTPAWIVSLFFYLGFAGLVAVHFIEPDYQQSRRFLNIILVLLLIVGGIKTIERYHYPSDYDFAFKVYCGEAKELGYVSGLYGLDKHYPPEITESFQKILGSSCQTFEILIKGEE